MYFYQPGETREVFVECNSPDFPGSYQTCWQMSTPEGFLFGDEIWVICSVGQDMTVDLTQQLQSLSCDNNRVNYPVVQMVNPNAPLLNAQVPTATALGAVGIHSSITNPSQDSMTDMS